MTIYPAIDLKDGKCVRLRQGDMGTATVYGEDPAAVARVFEEKGAEWLHVVDLDGAFAGESRNLNAIRAIVDAVDIPVQLGGGIRSMPQLNALFNEAGISRAIIGTAALEDFGFLRQALEAYGGWIAVGIDAKDGYAAEKGWTQVTERKALDLAYLVKGAGIQTVIYTDISRDGMLTGPNFTASEELIQAACLDVIVSGGVAGLAHITKAREIGAAGVIIGKALYTGAVRLEEAIAEGRKIC